ncbi:DUF5069 domain-containing protein [Rariglobus hedericola]|uniref:DUF5069 domain-containing protein n=1 Tax=Rariglobus hedericola TaxID=2597822 RepID=A0A556QM90_9BACT|nr:DUF5069 domain-containing protein [Rariglobus hedericola]TSJ77743.1 DUF5069 domain-containing protein [Rariglobus hedericola]
MKLPAPREQLAGCVWLPRILAKARLLNAGELAPDYAARFGHASGVDGQFLAFFELTADEVRAVAAAGGDDETVAAWFAVRTQAARTSEWNRVAVNLGRAGFPMAERLPVALATTYAHLNGRGLETVFAVLEADEAL